MTQIPDRQYRLLLQEERLMAKRVVYLIRAKAPQPWWHIFIPFKFLLEYKRLKKDIRNFSARYVYLKQIALAAAYRSTVNRDQEKSRQEMQAELRDFCLHSKEIASQNAYEFLSQWMDLLFQHYGQLFQVQEKNYRDLIRKTYTFKEYQNFLDQLSRLEQSIDQAGQSDRKDGKSDPSIQQKQQAIQELRARELNDIFQV